MPIEVTVGKKTYQSTNSNHAEELAFANGANSAGNITVEMNGWPCTGERNHDCHELFKKKSANRTITVVVTDDKGGYAANHGKPFGSKGTITYNNGAVTYA